jgi:hypothetical protein
MTAFVPSKPGNQDNIHGQAFFRIVAALVCDEHRHVGGGEIRYGDPYPLFGCSLLGRRQKNEGDETTKEFSRSRKHPTPLNHYQSTVLEIWRKRLLAGRPGYIDIMDAHPQDNLRYTNKDFSEYPPLAFLRFCHSHKYRTRAMGYFRSTVMPLLLSQTGASTPSYKTAAVISTFRQFSKGRKFLVQFQFALRDHRSAKSGLQRKSFRYPHLRTFIFIGCHR